VESFDLDMKLLGSGKNFVLDGSWFSGKMV
jgi:hypothetical protein